ncbi:uncharacterized protein LOC126834686 [Adelges cooleyi]|uniref:uncharacterized protein LOC126834686 n=1 Tax=Adelges cooleyi TaxID=133065 RepID=UPI00217FE2A0|nr:uncharacterized protein LOC126834686 [Adelges cooleyi]
MDITSYTVVLLLTVLCGLQASGEEYNNYTSEEELILQAMINKFVYNYKSIGVQPSTKPSTHIQRISKKRQDNSPPIVPSYPESAAPIPFPINPFFTNPHYHHAVYTNYVPLTTHVQVLPMPDLVYPQEESHHRIYVPLSQPYPYRYEHIPVSQGLKPSSYLTPVEPTYTPVIVSNVNSAEDDKTGGIEAPAVDIPEVTGNQHAGNNIHVQTLEPQTENTVPMEPNPIEEDNKNPTRIGKILETTPQPNLSNTDQPPSEVHQSAPSNIFELNVPLPSPASDNTKPTVNYQDLQTPNELDGKMQSPNLTTPEISLTTPMFTTISSISSEQSTKHETTGLENDNVSTTTQETTTETKTTPYKKIETTEISSTTEYSNTAKSDETSVIFPSTPLLTTTRYETSTSPTSVVYSMTTLSVDTKTTENEENSNYKQRANNEYENQINISVSENPSTPNPSTETTTVSKNTAEPVQSTEQPIPSTEFTSDRTIISVEKVANVLSTTLIPDTVTMSSTSKPDDDKNSSYVTDEPLISRNQVSNLSPTIQDDKSTNIPPSGEKKEAYITPEFVTIAAPTRQPTYNSEILQPVPTSDDPVKPVVSGSNMSPECEAANKDAIKTIICNSEKIKSRAKANSIPSKKANELKIKPALITVLNKTNGARVSLYESGKLNRRIPSKTQDHHATNYGVLKPEELDNSSLWYENTPNQRSREHDNSREQTQLALNKKIAKLFKPEYEKQILTGPNQGTVIRIAKPGEQDRTVLIILPVITEPAKNMAEKISENVEIKRS